MVKLIGPLGSFSASGSLANTLVYAKWRGRQYARELVTPANPRSAGQTGFRSMWKFLSQKWAAMTAAEKASWQTLADAGNYLTFNAYMRQNARRWRNFDPPSKDSAIPAGDVVGVTSVFTATAGIRQITIANDLVTLNQNWGRMIFKGLTGFSTTWSNCIAVILLDSLSVETNFVDTPLVAGTYYYNARDFASNGVLGAELGEINAVVT